jgi:hypothetical protein
MSCFPNFLIIGAAKSGTYTLHAHLGHHPDVFMCRIKEPHYFSYGANATNRRDGLRSPVHAFVESRDAYLKLFADRDQAKMAGESSVSYLYVPGTAERIFEFNPEMKIIVSLRNPIERAYSSFYYAKSYGIEPSPTLREGLEAEADRIRRNGQLLLRYRDLGLYASQLKRYYNVFPRDQIKVIIYDDFVEDAMQVVCDLYDFIGVASDIQPDVNLRVNMTKAPDDTNPLHRLISGENAARSAVRKLLPMNARQKLRVMVRNFMFKRPPPMSRELGQHLKGVFREEIEQLQELLGRDLSAWLD